MIPLMSCDSLRMRAMMGRLNHDREQLFYSFRLMKQSRTISRFAARFFLRLDRRERDFVGNIVHQSAAREVVYRLGQPLQHRPHAHHMGAAVHRVLGGVGQGLLSYVI